ncbi:hypothetical protein RB195_016666 [Necator americanus]|uniref:HEAT repeat protein n=1 Tax=Necator americanus TaxID=51031 RepID=A0ABR1C1J9_NECAM
MVASCTVVDQLKQFLERCSTIEELPHSFDDTLVDSLIDNIDLNDERLTEFIKSSFTSVNFETATSVVVSLLLRLYAKLAQTIADNDEGVSEQLTRTEVLLEQDRPAKVFSDLFTLYIISYRFKQEFGWDHVVFWAIAQLPNEGLSIFVRRLVEDFLCLTQDEDVVQLFLASVAELFCCTDSILIMNGTARVLLNFADRLNPDQIGLIIDTIQTGDLLGDTVYQLAARIRPDMGLLDDLSLSKWRNETARCQTIMKLILQSQATKLNVPIVNDIRNVLIDVNKWWVQFTAVIESKRHEAVCSCASGCVRSDKAEHSGRWGTFVSTSHHHNPREANDGSELFLCFIYRRREIRRSDTSDLIAAVLLSPFVKLGSFVNVIDLLSDKELQEYLPSMCRIVTDRRRAPLSDLQGMISKLAGRLDIVDLPKVLESCFNRLLESPCLLEELCKGYGNDCLNHPSMASIRDRLAVEITKAVSHSDWEVRDTVVEIAAIVPCFRPMLGPLIPLVRFDRSCYVRAAALRCLILDAQYYEEELPQLCENVILLDVDAEPRLVAIRYLQSTLAKNISHVFRILPKAIEDTDDEIRRIMIEMCSTLLVVEEYAADTMKELQEWTEDAQIGAAVRAVLGALKTNICSWSKDFLEVYVNVLVPALPSFILVFNDS